MEWHTSSAVGIHRFALCLDFLLDDLFLNRHVNFFQKRQTVSKDLFTFIFHGKNRKNRKKVTK